MTYWIDGVEYYEHYVGYGWLSGAEQWELRRCDGKDKNKNKITREQFEAAIESVRKKISERS